MMFNDANLQNIRQCMQGWLLRQFQLLSQQLLQEEMFNLFWMFLITSIGVLHLKYLKAGSFKSQMGFELIPLKSRFIPVTDYVKGVWPELVRMQYFNNTTLLLFLIINPWLL